MQAPHLVVVGAYMGLKPQLYLIEQAELGIVDGVSKTGWTHITDIVIGGRTLRYFITYEIALPCLWYFSSDTNKWGT